MTTDPSRPVLQIDIVSDVVCPWCIVGYRQLDRALSRTGVLAHLRWHPFELNSTMPAEGQNLRDHIMEKYGTTAAQSQQAREQLTRLGKEVGFEFNFSDDSRIVNTFQAHQLLDWAEGKGRQHPLKLALFTAYFTQGRDVSQIDVLVAAAGEAGLDPDAAREALRLGDHAAAVREKQKFWTDRGVRGVPAMVFGGKYLVTGAQGEDTYVQVIERCLAEAA
ncbi:DsbA family oxidoreductase [Primorskyibacter sp. S87]|uniref:DsbA family oxidoreductase n=1 Tax=Primorskyibacter sp. S87 TaxID=3415126 RepID=UPI003C7BAB1A